MGELDLKVKGEVERDFYALIKSSSLGKAIRGQVYRDEMRPAGSTAEDLVISFLAGLDEQTQSGVVVLNLYVPDLTGSDGRAIPDLAREIELEREIRDFVFRNTNTEYRLETDTTPVLQYNEQIKQHFVYARIKFYRMAECQS